MPPLQQTSFIRLLRYLFLLCFIQTCAGAQSAGASSVRIGNFLRGSPCGIAWVVEDSAAFVMDTGGPYVAGTAAADDSYHLYRFPKGAAHLVFEWGRTGNNVVGRIKSDRPVTLDLTLASGWPNWTTTFTAAPDGASAMAQAQSGVVHWTLRTSPSPASSSSSAVSVNITPQAPVRFVAGIDELPSFGSIDDTLETAAKRYGDSRPAAAGDWGDFVAAISDNMNNSRLYGSDNHLLAHCVSRRWSATPNGFPYFGWDSFFNANLAALDDPIIARNTIRAILAWETPEGMVPNFGHWDGDGITSPDRSEPPVAALCVWKMHVRYADDLDFLREVYPKLVAYHDWWPKYRDVKHDGLLEWGSTTGEIKKAMYETGWDDNLHFSTAKMQGTTLNCYAVDLASMWSMDAHYLALIADALGKSDDAARFRQDESAMNRRINDRLWNEQLGVYCSRFWDDTDMLEAVDSSAFGAGFAGEYFSDEFLQTRAAKRRDPEVYFKWHAGAPIAPIRRGSSWSARWTATFTPPAAGRYRFDARTNDSVRVTVDGKAIIDSWSSPAGGEEQTADVTFADSHPVAVVIEFHQHSHDALLYFTVTMPKPAHGAFLTRLTPMNFYPLSAGAADPGRAQRVMSVLTDPKKFWGRYLLPTVSYDDPGYHYQEYWRGDVWGPSNYLAWIGIKRYGSPEQIAEFADRNVSLFMHDWLAEGICSENYLSTTGQHGHDPHYTWGALLDLIGLESIVDVDDSGRIVLNGAQTKTVIMKNIPLLGRRYDVKTEPGSAVLMRDGRTVLAAHGQIDRAESLP